MVVTPVTSVFHYELPVQVPGPALQEEEERYPQERHSSPVSPPVGPLVVGRVKGT